VNNEGRHFAKKIVIEEIMKGKNIFCVDLEIGQGYAEQIVVSGVFLK